MQRIGCGFYKTPLFPLSWAISYQYVSYFRNILSAYTLPVKEYTPIVSERKNIWDWWDALLQKSSFTLNFR